MASRNTGSPPNNSRMIGIAIPLILAAIAFAVQWGVVTTKLGHMDKRMTEILDETKAIRADNASLSTRLALVEGKLGGVASP